ncbi:MAG: 3-hydroxyacyl-CoA dehydrogenase NAD-binding domain-containing protein [Rhodobacter sp.]|nr:3-hydroxyacyl-CoA dehydrogenase NAD-binding domain-containing protein [Rhodobacter sp.]
MSDIAHTAVLGAGTIGASWSALFLAAGRSVSVFDPAPEAEARVRDYIETAWPALTELGLTERGDPGRISFHTDAAAAVRHAEFVQENVPERIALKHRIIAEAEPALAQGAIFSSSTSGLTWEAIAEGFKDPSHFVLGHPFNPPHLIPLVEMTAGPATEAGAMARARAFYEDIGKVTIRLMKGMPGHVANRLQAAVWREAVHLVVEGVASVEDVDKAMWAGPGLRWAAMGPTMLFHLGAGEGGLQAFCDHFRDTFNGWWDGLGQVRLTDEVIETIVDGVRKETRGATPGELSTRRDALIVAIQKSLHGLRSP